MTHLVLKLKSVNLKSRSRRSEFWKEVKTEAPKRRLEGAQRSVARASPKHLKTWRPLIVLAMVSSVLFQEYTCLLPVSPAPRAPSTVFLLVALPPYTVNPSTAQHLRAHAPRNVHAYSLAIDQIIKLQTIYISCYFYFFFYGSPFQYICFVLYCHIYFRFIIYQM
ncbi:hypothetical protein Bca4012_071555 [Brassica carinata]